MGLCTAFVFAALVEFTIVNFWFRKQRWDPNKRRSVGSIEVQENGRGGEVQT